MFRYQIAERVHEKTSIWSFVFAICVFFHVTCCLSLDAASNPQRTMLRHDVSLVPPRKIVQDAKQSVKIGFERKVRTKADVLNDFARASNRKHSSKVYEQDCSNPDALGVTRVLEVDTKGGIYLSGRYRERLPLKTKEVVLTFDDGPLPRNTNRVLKALDDACTKATFFIVGKMAKAYPDTLRRVALSGHTIGYHTMSHPFDITKKPLSYARKDISDGWRVVDRILYGKAGDKPVNSFFRYPSLVNSPAINSWLSGLDMGVFASDVDGRDWLKGYLSARDAGNVVEQVLRSVEHSGRGVILLHDIKPSSSHAIAAILKELKTRGYKIVHIVPKGELPSVVAR